MTSLPCSLLICRKLRLAASGIRSPWYQRRIPSSSAEAWIWTCLVGPQPTSRYPSEHRFQGEVEPSPLWVHSLKVL